VTAAVARPLDDDLQPARRYAPNGLASRLHDAVAGAALLPEATLEQFWPLQTELVNSICEGDTVAADLFPVPAPAERQEPRVPRRPNTVSVDQTELADL